MGYYTIASPGTNFNTNKTMIGVFNGAGSGRVVRLYRAWLLNNQTTAVTGVNVLLELRGLTTGSGGTSIIPTKHDTEDEALPSQVITATNMTTTTSTLFRRCYWSSDEPVAAGPNSNDEIQTIPYMNIIWDSYWSYNNSTVQPIVLRAGEGIALICTTVTTVGVVDAFFEISVGTT